MSTRYAHLVTGVPVPSAIALRWTVTGSLGPPRSLLVVRQELSRIVYWALQIVETQTDLYHGLTYRSDAPNLGTALRVVPHRRAHPLAERLSVSRVSGSYQFEHVSVSSDGSSILNLDVDFIYTGLFT